jgi:hypothetical protein
LPILIAFSDPGTLSPNKGIAQGTLPVVIVLFKDKKLKTKGCKNIYQELMKKVEKKEDTVAFL